MDEEFESLCPFCIIQKKGTGKNPIPFLVQKERLDGFSTRRVRFANSLFYVPFCSAKRWTKSSSLSKQIHIYKKKKHKEKILVLFLAQKERLDGFSPVVFALRTVYFMSLFAPQKDGRRVRVSPSKFIYTKRKSTKEKSLCFFWRRRRDSTGFQPVVFALRTVYFMSLFAPQKDGRRVRVSLPFLHYTEKRYRGKSRYLSWRRRRDSNSRAGYPTYALSRGASSPT